MDVMIGCFAVLLMFSRTYSDDIHETDPCESRETGIYPHPECQMYYNCSMTNTDGNFRPWLGNHVMECPYPKLFSRRKLSCERFDTVNCGNRIEFIHGCEYHNNQCNGPNCRPCIYDYSNCTIRDGTIAMDSMPNSPFYGQCEGWRFTKKQCPDGKIFEQISETCIYN